MAEELTKEIKGKTLSSLTSFEISAIMKILKHHYKELSEYYQLVYDRYEDKLLKGGYLTILEINNLTIMLAKII